MSTETDKTEMVMCRLIDPEGVPLGSPMYIPKQAGPLELTDLANKLLNNDENLAYAFYVSGEELCVPVGAYLEKIKDTPLVGTMKSNLSLRPCPDGKQLASGSSDSIVRLWDLNTQTPMFTCRGHINAVLSIAWSPDGNHLVSGAATGEVCCWIPKTGELDGNPLTVKATRNGLLVSRGNTSTRIWDTTLGKSLTNCSQWTYMCVLCQVVRGGSYIYMLSRWYNKDVGSYSGGGSLFEEPTIDGKNLIFEVFYSLWMLPRGHVHRVESLALSTEYVLRTGAFDHTGKQYSSPEEIIEAALKRYEQAKGKSGERLVSVHCDYTMFLWEGAFSEHLT
ncbi:unnamed protein product [Arabis nemorensis]|uniref:NLE domain-containing protein n=1 Tax=Arabis nemorensis TaxID=586526 RepID=A0A565BW75_9BRAS|nr:unnamed protein product [Arabis nemorensis]